VSSIKIAHKLLLTMVLVFSGCGSLSARPSLRRSFSRR